MKLSLEYIAGLFDGEGWITVNTNKRNLVPTVGIKMNGLNLLKELHKMFGGYCYQRKTFVNRPLTEWSLRGAFQVTNFLKQIEPYFIIKKEQALLCLELCETYSVRDIKKKWIKKIKKTKNIIDARQKFTHKIKKAKLKVS